MKEYKHIVLHETPGFILGLYSALAGYSQAMARAFKDVAKESKRGVRVTFTAVNFDHTDPQRKYYHMWKNAFADFCGTTPDEMHEHLLCEAYGSEVVHTKIGPRRRPMQRSSTADRTEYSVLIDVLIRVAGEMGFVVPPPQREEQHESPD